MLGELGTLLKGEAGVEVNYCALPGSLYGNASVPGTQRWEGPARQRGLVWAARTAFQRSSELELLGGK